jgi:2-dehydro-3-deoxyphosphogluconate aldolase / (4S)-4-hydroxy-2-oxoglutarate aldolase
MSTPAADDQLIMGLEECGIVPVLTASSPELAVGAARALLEGGIRVVEVTFRTAVAASAIAAIREGVSDMIVGAGTVLSVASMEDAIRAGASFGVSPGYDPEVGRAARQAGFFFMPGVATPTEIGRALMDGFGVLKFFPAENMGGAKTVAAMFAPFLHLKPRVVPTGSITIETMGTYLKLPYVVATGASWVCPGNLIEKQDWAQIRELSEKAVKAIREVRPARAV